MATQTPRRKFPKALDDLKSDANDATLKRIETLQSAAEAWAALRVAAGAEFERAGAELVRTCLAFWPQSTEHTRGTAPAKTLSRIESAVAKLNSAIGSSPALSDLTIVDLLPDSTLDAVAKAVSRGTDMGEIDEPIGRALERLQCAAADRLKGRRGDAQDPATEFGIRLIESTNHVIGKPVYACAVALVDAVFCTKEKRTTEQLRKAWTRSRSADKSHSI